MNGSKPSNLSGHAHAPVEDERPTPFEWVRPSPLAVSIQSDWTLALTPAQGVSVFCRDFVRSPGEREKVSSAADNLTLR